MNHISIPILERDRPLFKEEMPLNSVKTLTINTNNLIKKIRLHLNDLLYKGIQPRHIIIGQDLLKQLHIEIKREVRFPMQVPLHENGNLTFMGIDVYLIPYMYGLLALPELTPYYPGANTSNSWALNIRDQLTSTKPIIIEDTDIETAKAFSFLHTLRDSMEKWLRQPAKVLDVDVPGLKLTIG